MKRSRLDGEGFDAREMSNAALTASMFAASVGMIWDLATGHVSAFDRLLSNISDDDREMRASSAGAPTRPPGSISSPLPHRSFHSTARGNSSNA